MSAPSRLHYKDGEDDSGGGDMEKKKKTRQEEAWRAKAKRQGEEEIRPMLPSARHRCEGTSVSDMALHRWYSRAMDWGKGMPLKVSDNTPKIFEWASPVENRLFSIPIPFPKLTLDEKTGDLRGLGWYLPVPQTSRKSPSYVFLPNFPTLKAISHSALDRLIHASRGPHTTLLIERCKYLHSPDRRHIILWLNSESGRNSILLWTLRHDGVVFWWQLVLEPLWDDSSSISSDEGVGGSSLAMAAVYDVYDAGYSAHDEIIGALMAMEDEYARMLARLYDLEQRLDVLTTVPDIPLSPRFEDEE